MRVCYFGTYRAGYVRNRLMIDRLKSQGIDVIECHEQLWRGFDDREQAAVAGWRRPAFWWRAVTVYLRLFRKYFSIGPYDIMLVGYPGQPDLPLARLLSRLRKAPLVWDVLMSLVLIAEERGIGERSPAALALLRNIERLALKLPDRIIIDTPAYAAWFEKNYGLRQDRVRLLPLGADDRVFQPARSADNRDGVFICLYYGSFLKSHGVQTILEAARLLVDRPEICFELIGDGPERVRAEQYVNDQGLGNVRFSDWTDPSKLVQKIANADLCLGTFGETRQGLVTMQNKIHEAMACARPVLTGDSPAIRGLLAHGEHIYLCPRQDGAALAGAITTLYEDPALRERLAKSGHSFYTENLAFDRLAEQLTRILGEIADPGRVGTGG